MYLKSSVTSPNKDILCDISNIKKVRILLKQALVNQISPSKKQSFSVSTPLEQTIFKEVLQLTYKLVHLDKINGSPSPEQFHQLLFNCLDDATCSDSHLQLILHLMIDFCTFQKEFHSIKLSEGNLSKNIPCWIYSLIEGDWESAMVLCKYYINNINPRSRNSTFQAEHKIAAQLFDLWNNKTPKPDCSTLDFEHAKLCLAEQPKNSAQAVVYFKKSIDKGNFLAPIFLSKTLIESGEYIEGIFTAINGLKQDLPFCDTYLQDLCLKPCYQLSSDKIIDLLKLIKTNAAFFNPAEVVMFEVNAIFNKLDKFTAEEWFKLGELYQNGKEPIRALIFYNKILTLKNDELKQESTTIPVMVQLTNLLGFFAQLKKRSPEIQENCTLCLSILLKHNNLIHSSSVHQINDFYDKIAHYIKNTANPQDTQFYIKLLSQLDKRIIESSSVFKTINTISQTFCNDHFSFQVASTLKQQNTGEKLVIKNIISELKKIMSTVKDKGFSQRIKKWIQELSKEALRAESKTPSKEELTVKAENIKLIPQLQISPHIEPSKIKSIHLEDAKPPVGSMQQVVPQSKRDLPDFPRAVMQSHSRSQMSKRIYYNLASISRQKEHDFARTHQIFIDSVKKGLANQWIYVLYFQIAAQHNEIDYLKFAFNTLAKADASNPVILNNYIINAALCYPLEELKILFDEAVQQQKINSFGYHAFIKAATLRGQSELIIKAFNSAVEQRIANSITYNLYINAMGQLDQFTAAQDAFNEAVRLGMANEVTYSIFIKATAQARKLNELLAAFDEAYSKNFDSDLVYIAAIKGLQDFQNSDSIVASEIYCKALEKKQNSKQLHLTYIDYLLKNKHLKNAEHIYSQVIKPIQFPDHQKKTLLHIDLSDHSYQSAYLFFKINRHVLKSYLEVTPTLPIIFGDSASTNSHKQRVREKVIAAIQQLKGSPFEYISLKTNPDRMMLVKGSHVEYNKSIAPSLSVSRECEKPKQDYNNNNQVLSISVSDDPVKIIQKYIDNNQVLSLLKPLIKLDDKLCLTGGAIRDILLSKSPSDLDIMTTATLNQVKECFPQAEINGHAKKSCKVIINNLTLDFSTFDHLKHNAMTRDFTINALYYSFSYQKLLDPCEGLNDLSKGELKCIGSALMKFEEQPIRKLRAIRIALTHGFRIEKSTYQAMLTTQECPLIKNSTLNKLKNETMLIAQLPDKESALKLLSETGLLPQLLSYLKNSSELLTLLDQNPNQKKSNQFNFFSHSSLEAARPIQRKRSGSFGGFTTPKPEFFQLTQRQDSRESAVGSRKFWAKGNTSS